MNYLKKYVPELSEDTISQEDIDTHREYLKSIATIDKQRFISHYPPTFGGFIYIASNRYMPGIYKVGFTRCSPEKRVRELYSTCTSVPFQFDLEYSIECRHSHYVEQLAHRNLDKYRINKNREFFKDIELELLKQYIICAIEEYEEEINGNSEISKIESLSDEDIKIRYYKHQSEINKELFEKANKKAIRKEKLANYHQSIRNCNLFNLNNNYKS